MHKPAYALRAVFLAALSAGLVACGGGGGGTSSSASSGDSNSSTNAPPTISGRPGSTVQAGQAYSFQPSAQDPEGATLEFSVQNLPSWATFNTATGRLSGTPAPADIGSYANIAIAVSDAQQTARLSPFTINVVDVGTGVATLSWTPPTSNTDGSALGDLAGYRVLYGRSTDQLSQVIDIFNASASSYVVEGLSSGTWYFGVVAVSSSGNTSDLSNIATKTVS